MNTEAIIKRIDNLETFAQLIVKEATELRKSLPPFQEAASRKGKKNSEAIAAAVARRRKNAFKA